MAECDDEYTNFELGMDYAAETTPAVPLYLPCIPCVSDWVNCRVDAIISNVSPGYRIIPLLS